MKASLLFIPVCLLACLANAQSANAPTSEPQSSFISVGGSIFQSKEFLASAWNAVPASRRNAIEAYLGGQLGVSSTGTIHLMGVYREPYSGSEQGNGLHLRLLHFQQLDLDGTRLFWSVLIDPDDATARVLYHPEGSKISAKFIPLAQKE